MDYLKLAKKHGTPLFIIDHDVIRENYKRFKKALPRVQAYYAIKANPDIEIIHTLFDLGASFDVASFPEFIKVHQFIEDWNPDKRHFFIYDKIIYANTIKPIDTLKKLRPYKPLVTYDNEEELKKIKENCNTAGLVLRIRVPDAGSVVEFNSKFGVMPSEAIPLIEKAIKLGLNVEGISFHVGSQCTNVDNYVTALNLVKDIFKEVEKKGHKLKIVDIGGGFPAPYDSNVPQFEKFAKVISSELDRLFPKKENIEIIAEPGRFMVATSAKLITQIIGKSRREGRIFYYINDGVYHTFSGVVFDHCQYHFKAFKKGKEEICAVVGQTCDGFDKISLAENLPESLEIGDYLLTENIGAYSIAHTTSFNGFPPAKVLHLNLRR